jgi:hypothetical protein
MVSCSIGIAIAKPLHINPFLKSVLIPGWGQLSMDKNYGYGMLTSEVLLWTTRFYTNNEQTLRDKDSYQFALKFAHLNPGKYSDQYYRDLARYNSSGFDAGGYNANVRADAIELYPYNPEAQQQYIDENSYQAAQSWQWDDYRLRKKYSTKRKEILELNDQAKLITGIIIANHLVSGIDMLRQKRNWHNATPSIGYYKNSPTLNLSLEF